MKISEIISVLEQAAPLALQEGYDNCGMQVGDKKRECTGVMLCVDATAAVVEEAVAKGCNLIVCHHPLLFKGLKRITGATAVERTVIAAISHGVAIYALHTALDNASAGISDEMAARLGLVDVATLAPRSGDLLKLTVFVPHAHVETVREAIFSAGAGSLGRYDKCSFSAKGEGTFRPLDGANPFVGEAGAMHTEPETRLEMILPRWAKASVEEALIEAHPYETPAYEFVAMENVAADYGSGAVGNLPTELTAEEMVSKVKEAFHSPIARCTKVPEKPIKRVAMCGGSGSFMVGAAIASGADAFITSDTSYHTFVDYAEAIFIIDIGHFESEECARDIFYRLITKKFPNFAVYYSQTEKNPIIYL